MAGLETKLEREDRLFKARRARMKERAERDIDPIIAHNQKPIMRYCTYHAPESEVQCGREFRSTRGGPRYCPRCTKIIKILDTIYARPKAVIHVDLFNLPPEELGRLRT